MRSRIPIGIAAILSACFAGTAGAAGDEIVVEATRRAANIQDVPLAITAIDAEQIAALQLLETKDIGAVVPNLQTYAVTANGAAMQLHARGASVQNPGFITSESPVGIYEDDVYRGRLATANLDLLDVERIEVLRGPQATLYGRNTMAGAIKIITRKPGEDNKYADLSTSVGSFDTWKLGGALGGVLLEDTLAGSVSAGYNKRDEGYQNNPLDGFEPGRWENRAVRGKLRWYGIENLDATLSAFYLEAENDGFNGVPYTPFAGPGAARGAPLGRFFDNFSPSDASSRNGRTNYGSTRQRGTTLDVTYDLPAARIRSITAHTDIDDGFGFDLAGGGNLGIQGVPGQLVSSRSNMRQVSQELHLLGTAFDDRVDWIVGFYYLNEDGKQAYNGFVPQFPPCPANCVDFHESTAAETNSYAVFGEGSWRFRERWSLTLGLRFTDENKDFRLACAGLTPGSGTGTCIPTGTGFATTVQEDFEEFTPRVGLSYDFGEQALLYLSAARGFQAGGFQTLCFGNLQCSDSAYDPQDVWSYEFGYKGTIADRLVIDTALFFAQYDEIQQTVITPVLDPAGNPTGFVTFPTENIGEADVWGIELGADLATTERLNLFLTAGFMSTSYGRIDPASGAAQAGASDLPSSPSFTARAGFDYTAPFGGDLELFFGGDLDYSHSYFSEATNTLKIKSYDRFNGFIGIGRPDGRWRLIVEGKNLFDDEDNVSGIVADGFTNIRMVLPPREIYATVRFGF